MLLTYGHLDARDLRGTTPADFLIAIEADLQLIDGDRIIYEEPSFPVVELARSLLNWVGSADQRDFTFESLSFEEIGSVTVTHTADGWVFGSIFVPDVTSEPVPWSEVDRCVRAFVEKVGGDLVGLGIDTSIFRC